MSYALRRALSASIVIIPSPSTTISHIRRYTFSIMIPMEPHIPPPQKRLVLESSGIPKLWSLVSRDSNTDWQSLSNAAYGCWRYTCPTDLELWEIWTAFVFNVTDSFSSFSSSQRNTWSYAKRNIHTAGSPNTKNDHKIPGNSDVRELKACLARPLIVGGRGSFEQL